MVSALAYGRTTHEKVKEESGFMQKIRDISEDEMIAVYLQTEFHSSRFRQDIAAHLQKEGIDPHLLQAPDWGCY